MVSVWYSMVMKRKIGLELYGPCSETGAIPEPLDTIATIDDNGRVKFHKLLHMLVARKGGFDVVMEDGSKHFSSECYLLYTSNSISNLKSVVGKMKERIIQRY